MKIALAEIDRIAALAKLTFSPEEREQIAGELEQIFAYVQQLEELTGDVTNQTHGVLASGELREDKVERGLTQTEALKNAPAANQGYFSVPKVISQ